MFPLSVSVPDPSVIALLVVVLMLKVPVPDWSSVTPFPVRFIAVDANDEVAPFTVKLPPTVTVFEEPPIATSAEPPTLRAVVCAVLKRLTDVPDVAATSPPLTIRSPVTVTFPLPAKL